MQIEEIEEPHPTRPCLERLVLWTGLETLTSESRGIALDGIKERGVVAVDVFANRDDRDSAIGYAEVCECRPGQHE